MIAFLLIILFASRRGARRGWREPGWAPRRPCGREAAHMPGIPPRFPRCLFVCLTLGPQGIPFPFRFCWDFVTLENQNQRLARAQNIPVPSGLHPLPQTPPQAYFPWTACSWPQAPRPGRQGHPRPLSLLRQPPPPRQTQTPLHVPPSSGCSRGRSQVGLGCGGPQSVGPDPGTPSWTPASASSLPVRKLRQVLSSGPARLAHTPVTSFHGVRFIQS